MSAITKEGVITLLEERRLDELAELAVGKKAILRYINRLLFERETVLRWRAIEAMGAVADRLAQKDPEAVRVILRNLLWSINDESGGIGWSAPECIGEIVYRRPEMFGEFSSIIISYANEEMIRSGVLWAAARIAQARPDLVDEAAKDLAEYIGDHDPAVRGYTIRYLDRVGVRPDTGFHSFLLRDYGIVPLYERGQLYEVTVADLARSWFSQPVESSFF